MHIRKIYSFAILIIIAIVIIYLIYGITKPQVLPAGTVMESIIISDSHTYPLIKERPTIVYLLSMTCGHCQYQVESLLKSYQRFESYDVLLLFIQNDALLSPFNEWCEFESIRRITLDEISQQNSITIFGQGGIPRFYLFDSSGTLLKKIMGEVKPEFLLNEFNSLFVRAQR